MSVASAGAGPAGDQAVVREVIGWLDSTLGPDRCHRAPDPVRGADFGLQHPVQRVHAVHGAGRRDGTIEGPVLGALVLFGLQEALSSQGAWCLVIVGGLAVIATLVALRGLWGLASDRFGWSLLPVGYRVRPPRD